MVRYFMSYKDYLNNNKIDIYISKVYLKKNYKKNYIFEPMIDFGRFKNELLNYSSKKNEMMVEILDDELNTFDDLLIRKFEEVDIGLYKEKGYSIENVYLINYDDFFDMSNVEKEKGTLVVLEPLKNEENKFNIKSDYDNICNDSKKRNELNNISIGADLYFHTNDKNLLEKYEEDLVEFISLKNNIYEISKNKLYVIDSIKTNDLYNQTSSSYACLDILSYDSIPVYITEEENGYSLSLKENEYYNKKGYIIKSVYLNKILKSNDVLPLLKFINLYEFENGSYKKTCLNINENDTNILIYRRINKK